MNLDTLTHDQLDALAAERAVDPYPSYGTKAAKVAAIRDASPLPSYAVAVATVPLSGWAKGETRTVEVDGRLLRRAANGLVRVLSTIEAPFTPHPADPDATDQTLEPPDAQPDSVSDADDATQGYAYPDDPADVRRDLTGSP